ncbi:MAG: hypothetical protein WCT11_00040 [Candidatus Magasanikbacteria bacterium]
MVEKFVGGPKEPIEGQDNIIDFNSFKKSREQKELTKGSEFTIPSLGGAANFGYETSLPWVDLARGKTGHGSENKGFIQEGKKVVVMGTSKEFGVLCKYKSNTEKEGMELEDGALFFIDADELLFWPKLTELQEQKRKRKDDEVKKILGEK